MLPVITVVITTILTILVLTGYTRKSYAAILGTISGVVIAGSIGIILTVPLVSFFAAVLTSFPDKTEKKTRLADKID